MSGFLFHLLLIVILPRATTLSQTVRCPIDLMAQGHIRCIGPNDVERHQFLEAQFPIEAEDSPMVGSGIRCSCWDIEDVDGPGVEGCEHFELGLGLGQGQVINLGSLLRRVVLMLETGDID